MYYCCSVFGSCVAPFVIFFLSKEMQGVHREWKHSFLNGVKVIVSFMQLVVLVVATLNL